MKLSRGRSVIQEGVAVMKTGRMGYRSALVLLVLLGVSATGARADAVTYNFTVNSTWSEATHPGIYPAGTSPHFTQSGFVNHNDQVSFWGLGELASPGVKRLAETGNTSTFQIEAQAAVIAGTAGSEFIGPFTASPGSSSGVVDVSDQYPLLTMVSMIGPSPDWFVGIDDVDLRENGIWRNQVVIDLYAYDAGTRSAEVFELFGPLSNPPELIALLDNTLLPGAIPMGNITFYLATSFIVGDLDHDGFVGIGDLNLVLGNWNQTVPAGNQVRGDISGDGFVGIDDLNLVLSSWNTGTPPGGEALANVPEPGAVLSMLIMFVAVVSRRGICA